MMKPNRWYLVLALLTLCGLFLVSCSDDDPVTPEEEEDNTAPTVASTDPVNGNPSVPADHTIVISFSEAMDPTTAAGRISMSAGNISALNWANGDKDLQVEHTAWDPGAEITVTVGPGLQDVAGNPLGTAYSFEFFVYINQVLVVDSDPDPGTTDFPVDDHVKIQFNRDMDVASLAAGITLTTPGKGQVPFMVQAEENYSYALIQGEDYPFDTPVTVNVSTDCMTTAEEGSEPLAAAFNFSFRTVAEPDLTPPEILSITPASGSTILPETSEIVIVFSEPVILLETGLLSANVQLLFAVELSGIVPALSNGDTVLTFSLAGPLPDGIPLYMQFDIFADSSGNVNDDRQEWEATVVGTADYFPAYEQFHFSYHVEYENSDPIGPKGSGTFTRWDIFEWENATDYRRYETESPAILEEWDYMTRTGEADLLRGFRGMDEGTPVDLMFDEPVMYLNRPMVPAEWSGRVTLPSGGGEATVNYSVEVKEGTTDIDLGDLKGLGRDWSGLGSAKATAIFWSDCRTVILDHDVRVGMDTVEVGSDTMYYSPGFGLVKFATKIEEFDPAWQEWQSGIWNGFEFAEGK
jgi:hypothetical protein